MNFFELLGELLPIILSSASISGGIFATIITFAIKNAKRDAENKQKERFRLEIMRMEGEEKLSALLFALIRHSRGSGSQKELDDAEKAYTEYLENLNRLKNEIIGEHTL